MVDYPPPKPDATIDIEAFRPFAEEAYGWTIGNDGLVWGLVAGDMGYDETPAQLGALVVQGMLAAGRDNDPIQDKLNELVELCVRALFPRRGA